MADLQRDVRGDGAERAERVEDGVGQREGVVAVVEAAIVGEAVGRLVEVPLVEGFDVAADGERGARRRLGRAFGEAGDGAGGAAGAGRPARAAARCFRRSSSSSCSRRVTRSSSVSAGAGGDEDAGGDGDGDGVGAGCGSSARPRADSDERPTATSARLDRIFQGSERIRPHLRTTRAACRARATAACDGAGARW